MIYNWCVVDELLDCLYSCLGAKLWMLQGEQWRDLLLSPKRDWLTQARHAEAGQGYTRTLAQAESSCFERGTISLRRETFAYARTHGSLCVLL